MVKETFDYKPIYPGFPWSATITINSTPGLFPVGCKLLADVRTSVTGPVIATLTTDAGHFTRISDTSILLDLGDGSLTAGWKQDVVLDLIRTDPNPDPHLGVRIKIAVDPSVTRRQT